MSDRARARARLLRFYPPVWRERYGDELLALLEDTYEDRPIPLGNRVALARSGVLERLRGTNRIGGDVPADRLRMGTALILCAWASFVVAGAGFAKFAEHWDAATPRAMRWLPGSAYDVVQWAAAAGAGVIAVAVAATLPTFVRSVRGGAWAAIRRPVLRAIVVTPVTVLVGAGLVLRAHHLGNGGRNGATYTGLATVLAVMAVATVATCTAAAVSTHRRIDASTGLLRLQGALALLLAATMLAILSGTLVWWCAIALDAPRFLGAGPYGWSPAPAPMVIVGLLMLVGLSLAAGGAVRVARSLPQASGPPPSTYVPGGGR